MNRFPLLAAGLMLAAMPAFAAEPMLDEVVKEIDRRAARAMRRCEPPDADACKAQVRSRAASRKVAAMDAFVKARWLETREALPQAQRAGFDRLQDHWSRFIEQACRLNSRMVRREPEQSPLVEYVRCKLAHQKHRIGELERLKGSAATPQPTRAPASAASAASVASPPR